MSYTRRERVQAAFSGQPIDRPPKGELLVEDEVVKGFGCQSLEQLLDILNADIVTLPTEDRPDWQAWVDKDFYTFGLYQGPFTYIWQNHDLKELSALVVHKPEEAYKMMKKDIVDKGDALFDALTKGCDGIILADDIASQMGPLVSPKFLERYYLPLIKELVAEIHAFKPGTPVVFHSDGNLVPLIMGLQASGLDGLQCLQPSAKMCPQLFAYGGFEKWIFWGNFEYENGDKMKSALDVAMEVPFLLYRWEDVGHYVFGSSGGLYPDLPKEAIATAYTCVDRYKRQD